MYTWIIVDGNNLIHSDGERLFGNHGAEFDAARWKLARLLDELVGELAERITVVFDGTVGGRNEAFQTSELQVVFSSSDTTADSLIEEMVARALEPGKILVVSSDRAERYTVGAAGAEVMGCKSFIELVRESRDALTKRLSRRSRQQTPRPSLGDFFPKDR